MEHLVEWMLRSMGAPAACITPLVGATILAGWAQNQYQNAKESAERSGGSLWNEVSFLIGILLIIFALSGVWTALQVLASIVK